MRRAGIVTVGIVGTYLTAVAGAAYPLSNVLIRPRLKRLRQLRSAHLRRFLASKNVGYEEVSFRSFDDTRLDGWWFGASAEGVRPTVIALHGVSKNRTDLVRFAIPLAAAGINVLLFDGRGHGGSDRRYVTYGFYEKRDVEAAIDFAVSKGASETRIGLAGVSMGASITLQVAAANRRVRAVWTDSPFASLSRVTMDRLRRWTKLPRQSLLPVQWAALHLAELRGKFDVDVVDPLGLASQITCPVYLVHGDADCVIDVDHSVTIFEALPSAEKQLWVVPGGGHGRAFRRTKGEYAQRLTSFFTRTLAE